MAQLKDSLVAGDLRVTGKIYGTATNSDKVNNLTVLTAVPANAKFTDTTYSSKTAASGGTEVSLVTTGEKYTWNNKSNLSIGTTASTAAAGNHTHTTSLATSTDTSSITLAHGGKYQLTAGGTNVIFTMPSSGNTDHRRAYYGTCSTAAGTAAKDVTLSNTDGWELVAGTIVGVKFSNSNTAGSTSAPVTLNVNGTGAKQIYYNNAAYTGTSNQVCGYANRVTYYMYDGTHWVWMNMGTLDGNSDTKVRQTLDTSNTNRPLLLAYSNNSTTTTNVDNVSYRNNSIYANPSTGLLTTTGISTTTINGVTVGSSPKFTDTTYSSKTATSGGTDVSLVTTGEKYTWNSKTSNTGTVTSITVKTSSPISGGSSTAVTGSGTWTISHANSGVTAGTYGSATAVPKITVDATGHVTGVTNTTITASAATKYTTCTLPVFTAAGSKAVTVSGVTANSNPVLDVYIDTAANLPTYAEAWSHIYRADTSTNTITFYSDAETSTQLTVMVKDY